MRVFSRAALEICQLLQWAPEIIHCHDWQTALIPLYLRTLYAWDRLFEKTRTLFTIHNLGYQGVFSSQILADLGLAEQAGLLYQEDLRAGTINFLKTGLLYAGMLSTVSPTYAREIQTEAHGFGLHPILSARWESLVGILNGVDYHEWDPATDTKIAANYTRKSLPEKAGNKAALLQGMGLPFDAEAPVFGIVSRLAHQKGFELIGEAMPAILGRHPARLVVLGSGEAQYEEMFTWLQRSFPQQVAFYRGYNDGLSHLIEAGSDMFLMPSRYEPCGLNQMYSLRYGTIPIVRNTGGLADTVRLYEPVSGEGTGFVFDHFTADGLRWAMEFALSVWPDKKAWRKLQRAGMACDYSWEHQSKLYVELYRRMAGR
jgi:starch synthase